MVDIGEETENQQVLEDYFMLIVINTVSGIGQPPIQAYNFKIKLAIIQLAQAS